MESSFFLQMMLLSLCSLRMPIASANILPFKAHERCNNGTSTFERTTGVIIPSSHFLFSELAMIQDRDNETWQYECYYLCKATTNCGGFYVDHTKKNCRLLPAVSSAIRLTFQPHRGSYFEKICLKAPSTCHQQWTFDRVVGMELIGNDDKILRNISTKTHCQQACLDETDFQCRSAEFNYDRQVCTLSKNDRRSIPEAFKTSVDNVDYLENQCVSVPSKCVYNRKARTFLPYSMARVKSHDLDANHCQEKCDHHEDFVCRAFVYDRLKKECFLSADNKRSVDTGAFSHMQEADYYERSDCLDVTMKCDATTMTAILTAEYPFRGKVYAMVNPSGCSTPVEEGNNSNQVALTLPLKSPMCGTTHMGNGTYTNSIIVQHHPNILRSSDRRIDIVCEYAEHKVKLKAGKQIVEPDITNISSVVTGVAPTPEVRLRLVNASGKDVSGVDLGSQVFLRAELLDQRVYGIMGTSLIARSGDGAENITLIDENGCPVETSVFPALELQEGSKSLQAPFQAFRFATDSTVRFQITISFCLNQCNPAQCDTEEALNVTSYGRKRRSINADGASVGLQEGDVISDVVMEGALFVRAKLERKDIPDSGGMTRSLKGRSVTQGNGRLKICTSPAVVIGVSIIAAMVQIAIISVCVFVTCSEDRSKSAINTLDDLNIRRLPSSLRKFKLCDGYSSSTASSHNSLAGFMH